MNDTLNLFRSALELVDYNVDLLLFVTESGRLSPSTVDFYKTISKIFLIESVQPNTVFICNNKGQTSWLQQKREDKQKQVEQAREFYSLIEKFEKRSFEFKLEFPSLEEGMSSDEVSLRTQLVSVSRQNFEEAFIKDL